MACKSQNSDADAKDVMSGPDAELSTLYENVRDMMSGPRCVVCGKPPGMSGGISWGGCRKHGLHIKCASKVEGLAQAISHYAQCRDLRLFADLDKKCSPDCFQEWNEQRVNDFIELLVKRDEENTWMYICKGYSGLSCSCPQCIWRFGDRALPDERKLPLGNFFHLNSEGFVVYKGAASEKAMMQSFLEAVLPC